MAARKYRLNWNAGFIHATKVSPRSRSFFINGFIARVLVCSPDFKRKRRAGWITSPTIWRRNRCCGHCRCHSRQRRGKLPLSRSCDTGLCSRQSRLYWHSKNQRIQGTRNNWFHYSNNILVCPNQRAGKRSCFKTTARPSKAARRRRILL